MSKLLVLICAICLAFCACSPNNVNEDNDLKQYFDEYKVTGCFGQFDNTHGEFTIYNLSRFTDSVYLPAETFDIINASIAIETGVIVNDSARLAPIDPFVGHTCNYTIPMYEAFRAGCTNWFQELSRRVGQDTLQRWLDSLGYGSRYHRAVIKQTDSFWLDNSVKITADEQLGLTKKLYFNQLPFKNWTQSRIRSMMLVTENNQYKLAYKTGTGTSEKGHTIGWVQGWIEENKHPYPFVLQVESQTTSAELKTSMMSMLDKILKHYGFKEGKK